MDGDKKGSKGLSSTRDRDKVVTHLTKISGDDNDDYFDDGNDGSKGDCGLLRMMKSTMDGGKKGSSGLTSTRDRDMVVTHVTTKKCDDNNNLCYDGEDGNDGSKVGSGLLRMTSTIDGNKKGSSDLNSTRDRAKLVTHVTTTRGDDNDDYCDDGNDGSKGGSGLLSMKQSTVDNDKKGSSGITSAVDIDKVVTCFTKTSGDDNDDFCDDGNDGSNGVGSGLLSMMQSTVDGNKKGSNGLTSNCDMDGYNVGICDKENAVICVDKAQFDSDKGFTYHVGINEGNDNKYRLTVRNIKEVDDSDGSSCQESICDKDNGNGNGIGVSCHGDDIDECNGDSSGLVIMGSTSKGSNRDCDSQDISYDSDIDVGCINGRSALVIMKPTCEDDEGRRSNHAFNNCYIDDGCNDNDDSNGEESSSKDSNESLPFGLGCSYFHGITYHTKFSESDKLRDKTGEYIVDEKNSSNDDNQDGSEGSMTVAMDDNQLLNDNIIKDSITETIDNLNEDLNIVSKDEERSNKKRVRFEERSLVTNNNKKTKHSIGK